jgi:hypothetical protein
MSDRPSLDEVVRAIYDGLVEGDHNCFIGMLSDYERGNPVTIDGCFDLAIVANLLLERLWPQS